MFKLTVGKKLKACRTILGMTRYDVFKACGIKESVIKQIEDDVDLTKAQWLVSFMTSRGLYLTDNGITTIPQETAVTMTTLTAEKIVQTFGHNKHFSAAWALWNTETRERFITTINAFSEQRFDMWFVNMGGQIRIGYKALDMQRGNPFAFIQIDSEGFYLLWHENLDAAFLSFSDHSAIFSDEQAKRLRQHLITHRSLVPANITELAAERLPSDYE